MGNAGETVSPLRGSTFLVGVNPGLTSRAICIIRRLRGGVFRCADLAPLVMTKQKHAAGVGCATRVCVNLSALVVNVEKSEPVMQIHRSLRELVMTN